MSDTVDVGLIGTKHKVKVDLSRCRSYEITYELPEETEYYYFDPANDLWFRRFRPTTILDEDGNRIIGEPEDYLSYYYAEEDPVSVARAMWFSDLPLPPILRAHQEVASDHKRYAWWLRNERRRDDLATQATTLGGGAPTEGAAEPDSAGPAANGGKPRPSGGGEAPTEFVFDIDRKNQRIRIDGEWYIIEHKRCFQLIFENS
jgi:hypothetical protein